MSSGTVHFPAILVTVTCNPRRCVRPPLSGRERKDFSEPELSLKGSPLLRISPLILDRSSEGYPSPKAPRDHLPLVFSLRGLLHKNAGTQAPEEGSPTNVRCKAPHLIKIILAYSPKKKRADPIEDESEVQQGHFCPPPFSRNRTWTLPLIQLPASKQLAFLYKEWKCG
ncbi:hypothetical protein BDE02_07G058600 [Populus trichocarpa]|nr:hypothetical protein BDE02_07G058600 [Populus trichocarpa]